MAFRGLSRSVGVEVRIRWSRRIAEVGAARDIGQVSCGINQTLALLLSGSGETRTQKRRCLWKTAETRPR